MPSPQITDALLALEAQRTLSLPMAALVLGAVSQVETLIELAERVCGPVFCQSVKTTIDGGGCSRK